MAKYGSGSATFTFGGTSITQHVDTVNGLRVESLLVDPSHTFGDTWLERLDTTIKQHEDIVLEGWYDDTAATGPQALLSTTGGAGSTFVYNPGGSNSRTVTAIPVKWEVMMPRGEMTRYRATLRPTGAVT